jgi:hypothetical protein
MLAATESTVVINGQAVRNGRHVTKAPSVCLIDTGRPASLAAAQGRDGVALEDKCGMQCIGSAERAG